MQICTIGIDVIGANLLWTLDDTDNSRVHGWWRTQRNFGTFGTRLDIHHSALGMARSRQIRLHLSATRAGCYLNLCFIQQIPPQHHQVWLENVNCALLATLGTMIFNFFCPRFTSVLNGANHLCCIFKSSHKNMATTAIFQNVMNTNQISIFFSETRVWLLLVTLSGPFWVFCLSLHSSEWCMRNKASTLKIWSKTTKSLAKDFGWWAVFWLKMPWQPWTLIGFGPDFCFAFWSWPPQPLSWDASKLWVPVSWMNGLPWRPTSRL